MMRKARTIWVKLDTIEKLDKLKLHPRQSYDEVINTLLDEYAKKR